MRSRSWFVWAAAPAAAGLMILSGCGGGGNDTPIVAASSSPTPTPTPTPATRTTAPVAVRIAWPVRSRSRDVAVAAGALSVTLTLKGASPTVSGGDFVFTVNRNLGNDAAYLQDVVSPQNALLGAFPLEIRYFAQSDGRGNPVGVTLVPGMVTVSASGTSGTASGIPDVSVPAANGVITVH